MGVVMPALRKTLLCCDHTESLIHWMIDVASSESYNECNLITCLEGKRQEIRMHLKTALIATLLTIGLGASTAQASPQVVVSIKPLHSLVSGVMAGVAQPKLLIRGHASPHAYALRPSGARVLQAAEVVFWIGEEVESFLSKPLGSLARKATVVALGDTEGIHWLGLRKALVWGSHEHEEEEAHSGHGHEGGDPHLWLDPQNAKLMVQTIVATLQAVDPEQAQAYQDNGQGLRKRLDVLDAKLREGLSSLSQESYLVFHDAYQYFEKRYNLHPIGAVTLSPEHSPGMKRLQTLREQVQGSGVRCVFTEPQFPPKLLWVVTNGLEVKHGVLDPVGAELSAGPDLYFTLLNNLSTSLRECLL